jgi:hypothetical protein
LLLARLFVTEGKTYSKLMLGTLFSVWRYSNAICCEKCSVCNDILAICNKFTESYSVLQQCYYVKLYIVQAASVKCHYSVNNWQSFFFSQVVLGEIAVVFIIEIQANGLVSKLHTVNGALIRGCWTFCGGYNTTYSKYKSMVQ